MAPVDANRKAQIEAYVKQAVQKRIAANEGIKTKEDLQTAQNIAVSIFVDDKMTAAEKDYAFKLYSETLLKNYYDNDKNGEITVKEFAIKEYENSQKLAENERDKVIAERSSYFTAEQMDVDGDGKISIDEFTYFQKSADKTDSKQDGVIHLLGEAWQVEAITGQNANNKTVQAIVEKYLTGENLTEEDQKYLSSAAENIRNAQALDASKNYKIRLNETQSKTIYLGDAAAYQDEAPKTDETTEPVPIFEDKTDETKDESAPVFEDKTEQEPTPVFNDKTKYTLRGLNQNTMSPYGMFGFSAGYMQPKPNKLFQLGNIIGNAFNLFFMGKFLFGHNDSMGGLRWWF